MAKLQSKFKIEIEKEDEKKEVEVVIQQLSPFKVSSMVAESMVGNGQVSAGAYIERAIEEEMIVFPTSLKEMIEEADNGIVLIGRIFKELQEFCGNPRCYALKQIERERKAKTRNLENGNSEHDIDGDKEAE